MPTSPKTYCRICEAACGLVVEHDPSGNPVRLKPDREHPGSGGYACAKGTRYLTVAQHKDRLLRPMRRNAGGHLEPTDWDEAIAESGAKLRSIVEKHGPHAVGVYFGNPLTFNSRGTTAMLGFMQALGTRNVYSAGSQDCNNKFAGSQIVHGSPAIQPIPDFDNADLAVIFGMNPYVSQGSFLHLDGAKRPFDRMLERGAGVIWIDPRRTESVERGGEHVPIRVGSDAWLLMALLNLLRHRYAPNRLAEGLDTLLSAAEPYTPDYAANLTGIPAERIRWLAHQIESSRRTAFHMSVGVNHGGFGTLAYVALQALIFLTGNMDAEGGSLFHPFAPIAARLAQYSAIGHSSTFSRIGRYPSLLGTMPGGILADEILTPGDGQIRAMIVIAGDPLHSMPDPVRLRKAFRSLDWLVTIDMFENATGREAHLLLPATSWLERWDMTVATMMVNRSPMIQYAGAVAPPPGQTRHEADILADLVHAMGGQTARRGMPMQLLTGKTASTLTAAGVEILGRLTRRAPYGVRIPEPKPRSYLGRGPLNPGHRLLFWHAEIERELARLRVAGHEFASPATPDQFVLLGRRRRLGHNSWLHGGGRDREADNAAWLSNEELTRLGLPGGGHIRIEGITGSLVVYARPVEGLMPHTVVFPHGLPDLNANDLIPSGEGTFERMSGQHRMTGIPVRVSAA